MNSFAEHSAYIDSVDIRSCLACYYFTFRSLICLFTFLTKAVLINIKGNKISDDATIIV